MSKLIFSEQAWDDFTYWQDQDKKTLSVFSSCYKT